MNKTLQIFYKQHPQLTTTSTISKITRLIKNKTVIKMINLIIRVMIKYQLNKLL